MGKTGTRGESFSRFDAADYLANGDEIVAYLEAFQLSARVDEHRSELCAVYDVSTGIVPEVGQSLLLHPAAHGVVTYAQQGGSITDLDPSHGR